MLPCIYIDPEGNHRAPSRNLAGHVTDDELAERGHVLALLARPSRA